MAMVVITEAMTSAREEFWLGNLADLGVAESAGTFRVTATR
jgi:hypothetical protein